MHHLTSGYICLSHGSYLLEYAKGVEAVRGDCVDLAFHGKFAVQDDAEVVGVVCQCGSFHDNIFGALDQMAGGSLTWWTGAGKMTDDCPTIFSKGCLPLS